MRLRQEPDANPNLTGPRIPETKKTRVLTDFQELVSSSVGKVLPIYGESLFENVPTTFAPVEHIPVTSDYVIGPGDELVIRGWGQLSLNVRTRVDRGGNIFHTTGWELLRGGSQV